MERVNLRCLMFSEIYIVCIYVCICSYACCVIAFQYSFRKLKQEINEAKSAAGNFVLMYYMHIIKQFTPLNKEL